MNAVGPTTTAAGSASPSWEEFRGDDRIFDNLTEISGFRLFCDIPPLIEFSDERRFGAAASRAYAVVAEAIRSAKFFRLENLTVQTTAGQSVRITYEDDVFDFRVTVSAQGQMLLERTGSTLDVFHVWYTRIGPHFWDMMNKLADALTETLGRRISINRAYFAFEFAFLDLAMAHPNNRRVLNYEIIGTLLKGLPDDQGALSEDQEVLKSAGRVDVTFSRWLKDGDFEWIERYELQAPANRGGERIECSFSYMGETQAREEGSPRTEFQPREFLERYDTAYGQFLRNRVMKRFLTDLMRGYSFRSVRSLG